MNDDTNLDLLDLDGDASDSLPEVAFTTPRPRKPWLLLGIALVVIALAVYIIVRTVSGPSSSSVEIDLDAEPEVVVDGGEMPMPPAPPMMDANPQPLRVPDNAQMPPRPMPMPPAQAQVQPEPVQVRPMPSVDTEPNVRVVEDRPEVTFNPNKVESKPVAKPVKTVSKPASKPAQKTAVKKAATSGATWYVQFGSYATRDAANAAGQKIRAAHSSLFAGKQFVVLASVLKDGRTTYRLRVAFNSSNDANGFCRNAKSDGLDCYVAK